MHRGLPAGLMMPVSSVSTATPALRGRCRVWGTPSCKVGFGWHGSLWRGKGRLETGQVLAEQGFTECGTRCCRRLRDRGNRRRSCVDLYVVCLIGMGCRQFLRLKSSGERRTARLAGNGFQVVDLIRFFFEALVQASDLRCFFMGRARRGDCARAGGWLCWVPIFRAVSESP